MQRSESGPVWVTLCTLLCTINDLLKSPWWRKIAPSKWSMMIYYFLKSDNCLKSKKLSSKMGERMSRLIVAAVCNFNEFDISKGRKKPAWYTKIFRVKEWKKKSLFHTAHVEQLWHNSSNNTPFSQHWPATAAQPDGSLTQERWKELCTWLMRVGLVFCL